MPKTLFHLSLLFTTALIYSGCSSMATNSDALSESMAITFSQPTFWLEPESTLHWRSDLVFFYNDSRKKPENIRSFLQQEVEDYLVAQKYYFPEDTSLASYGLVAVVVLGEGVTATDILKQFKLTPSFAASSRFEKGTLVIAILDAATEKILWRGALQANIDLNLAPEIRRQRVRTGISRLLSHLPRQKPDQ